MMCVPSRLRQVRMGVPPPPSRFSLTSRQNAEDPVKDSRDIKVAKPHYEMSLGRWMSV